MSEPPPTDLVADPAPSSPHARWRFLRDVAVFQFKLALDNMRDFALIPVTLVAAGIDLVFRGQREGALFYKVLEWGWHSEKVIGLYSMLEARDEEPLAHDYTVDSVLTRLEAAIVREYEKGGSAASVKRAVDRAIDQIQRGGSLPRAKVDDAVTRAAGKLREKLHTEKSPPAA